MDNFENKANNFCFIPCELQNIKTRESDFKYKLISWYNEKITMHIDKHNESEEKNDDDNSVLGHLSRCIKTDNICVWNLESNKLTNHEILNKRLELLDFKRNQLCDLENSVMN